MVSKDVHRRRVTRLTSNTTCSYVHSWCYCPCLLRGTNNGSRLHLTICYVPCTYMISYCCWYAQISPNSGRGVGGAEITPWICMMCRVSEHEGTCEATLEDMREGTSWSMPVCSSAPSSRCACTPRLPVQLGDCAIIGAGMHDSQVMDDGVWEVFKKY